MPVTTQGRSVIEKATGKVVAHGKTKKSAKSAARIRNWAHHAKKQGGKAYAEFKAAMGGR